MKRIEIKIGDSFIVGDTNSCETYKLLCVECPASTACLKCFLNNTDICEHFCCEDFERLDGKDICFVEVKA